MKFDPEKIADVTPAILMIAAGIVGLSIAAAFAAGAVAVVAEVWAAL